ncbi:hypothetical protein EDC04DRAFT_704285 [Pisolithus marmoratus]|nr:hypothetical protein EDC04DRAFT_704285 [Pisolithus marmoratus]
MPPGEYILSSDRNIVLLRGAGCAVTSITRDDTIVPVDAMPRVRQQIRQLLVFPTILVAILWERSTVIPSLWALLQEAIHLIFVLVIPVLMRGVRITDLEICLSKRNYVFDTRTGGVVFTLLLLQTGKTEEVMNELLPKLNTKAWKKWKTTIVDRIRCQGSFDFDISDWDDGTWSDTEKGLLIDLFKDAREAHEKFKRYLAESGSTT